MKKLIILLVLSALLFAGCNWPREVRKDIHELDGYTVVSKDIYYHHFFIVKTEYYNIFKETGRGLLEQGVKGEIIKVSPALFESVLEGEAIKPAR